MSDCIRCRSVISPGVFDIGKHSEVGRAFGSHGMLSRWLDTPPYSACLRQYH